jgi:hypothetical protein
VGVLTALGLLAVAAVVAWREWVPLGYVAGYAAIAACTLVVTMVRHRGDTVTLMDEAVVVRSRGAQTVWPWEQVLEVSWSSATWPYSGSGPVLRVKGGAYDDPGPNVPAQVASLPLFGAREQQAAVRAFRSVAEERGLVFTPGLVDLITSGKRRPRLPGERRDARGGSL